MEEIAKLVTVYISHAVEIIAAAVIAIALMRVLRNYLGVLDNDPAKKQNIRVQFGSSVAVALELMLGADVLATAVAPGWDEIGKLAAIAILRTGLNFFLEKELKHLNLKTIAIPDAKEERA